MKHTHRVKGYLALAVLVVVGLAPPEAYGSGRMLLVLMATFAFLLAIADGGIPQRYLAGGVLAMLLLIAHSFVFSDDLNRSVEFLGLLWSYYCLFGVFRYSDEDLRFGSCVVLILVAAAVSLYGIYQYLWGFDGLQAFVETSQAPTAVRAPVLGILASQRVFSTFALPGTLWGFLILTVPLHGALWPRASTWQRALILANVVLVVGVAALTESYGFVLGLLVVGMGWALTRPQLRIRRLTLLSALVVPLAGGIVGVLYAARLATYNPVWLRLQNWLSAWDIFMANPLGSGLNTYAILYLQHQQPGANDTQFAHNTPLQLVAELGVFGVCIMLLVALRILPRGWSILRSVTGVRRFLLLALLVWCVHNLMDINVYFGSIGAVGAALAGLFTWSGGRERSPTPPRFAIAGVGILSTCVLLASAMTYVSGEYLFRARGELEFRRLSDASESLRIAARINPFDSSIMHEAGQTEFELYYATRERLHLEAAGAYFSRAIQLSPLKVGPRIGLALCFSTEDRVSEAIQELKIAEALYPLGTQASNIRRMIERRQFDHPTQEPHTP